MPEHDDENFLLRWSRRKRDAGRGSDVAGAEREVLPGVDRPAPDAAGGVDPLEGELVLGGPVGGRIGERSKDGTTHAVTSTPFQKAMWSLMFLAASLGSG